jgi:hypothetical protein
VPSHIEDGPAGRPHGVLWVRHLVQSDLDARKPAGLVLNLRGTL